jgi:hypothetical protein
MTSENPSTDLIEHVARVFNGLSEPRRVYAVEYLSSYEPGSEVGLRELAKVVAGREHGKPPEEVTHPEYKSVRGSLDNWHLPALDHIGIIEYDDDRTTAQIKPDIRFHRATLALIMAWSDYQ